MVVFDAMGVLYEIGDDEGDLLIPYVRDLGCLLSDADIGVAYRQASLGHMTSAEFWAACGVYGDDEVYCSRHRLMPGMRDLLEDLGERGLSIACLTNDLSSWSRILRQRFGLHTLVETWVVSGDIGIRKPDPEAFRELSRATGVPLDDMVFFDDREANVCAAQALGIDAKLFISISQVREEVSSVIPISMRT